MIIMKKKNLDNYFCIVHAINKCLTLAFCEFSMIYVYMLFLIIYLEEYNKNDLIFLLTNLMKKKNSKNKPNTRISYSNVIRFLIKSSIDIVIYALFVSTLTFYGN